MLHDADMADMEPLTTAACLDRACVLANRADEAETDELAQVLNQLASEWMWVAKLAARRQAYGPWA